MATQHLDRPGGTIAFDDTGGEGPLYVLLPGAGDVRAEYRFITSDLVATGARVVTMDLRGHGESSAGWASYTMEDTAGDLVALLEHLEAGPATIVATSFAPAAALWAAADQPELFARLVLVSAHLEAAPFADRLQLQALRGPLAAPIWANLYKKWHPGAPPADLDDHIGVLKRMMADPQRRSAVRQTLAAHRNGLRERLGEIALPTLVIMGEADDHFTDPDAAAEGRKIGEWTGAKVHLVPSAGHYPHVEYPGQVATAVADFVAETST